jgi:predicted XRE-type DNA-binding protein
MTLKIGRSSGDVFRDVGFGSEEAEHLRIRADLMIEVRRLIKARRLAGARAAKLFGVTSPESATWSAGVSIS